MESEKPKGEMPPREAAARDAASVRKETERTGRLPTEDEREDEGYDQPESSAQKGTEREW